MLLALELAFQVLPVSTATNTGYYVHPHILTYPPNHQFTTATGWDLKNARHHKSNNYGFLADRDFSYNPKALGLVGDSFVEANMLAAPDRLAPQLEKTLGGRPVYAFGGPGSSLLDYAERIKFAHEAFGINDFAVILERGDLIQSLCESGNNHGPCLSAKTLEPKIELQVGADWKKKVLRHSALAQYLFSQLKVNPTASLKNVSNRQPAHPPHIILASRSEEDIAKAVSTAFFEKLKFSDNIRLVFVIDAERTRLFDDRAQEDNGLAIFQEIALKKGAKIISPVQNFREYKTRTGLILEVGPLDAHWNREAVKILASLLGSTDHGGTIKMF